MYPSLVQSLAVLALSTSLISAQAVRLSGLHREQQQFYNTSTPGLVFDGRMAAATPPAFFESPLTSPYIVNAAVGKNLSWGKIIRTPQHLSKPLFDPQGKEAPIEVTLSDSSIFHPINQRAEFAIRRADLLPNISDPISAPPSFPQVSGLKTLHFSLQTSSDRSLNYSHEYQLVWMETQASDDTQFSLKTGTLAAPLAINDPKLLQLFGRDDSSLIFSVPFDEETWHNFGIVLDFDRHTTQVYYSTNQLPLQQITQPMANDVSGGGEYHLGLLKKAIGSDPKDPKHTGIQPSGIDEGVIFSGIFIEDTALVGVTLSQ